MQKIEDYLTFNVYKIGKKRLCDLMNCNVALVAIKKNQYLKKYFRNHGRRGDNPFIISKQVFCMSLFHIWKYISNFHSLKPMH